MSRFYSLSCETYSGTGWTTWSHAATGCSFYSLSCETYSGTVTVFGGTNGAPLFLFAVLRDVQRNEGSGVWGGVMLDEGFLFAVLRDVQRNPRCCCSTCRIRSTFLFAVLRDVQRNDKFAASDVFHAHQVSIRCLARRTAELRFAGRCVVALWFLFAVLRDVQRNIPLVAAFLLLVLGFYSLSCETYSGT